MDWEINKHEGLGIETCSHGHWQQQGVFEKIVRPFGEELAKLKSENLKLHAALSDLYAWSKWIQRKHKMSLADVSPEIGMDDDGSDLGAMSWLILDYNVRKALGEKQEGVS